LHVKTFRFKRNIFLKFKEKIMSAQQIKLNINTLVNSIEDESILDACYEVLDRIVKIAKKSRNTIVLKEETGGQSMPFIQDNNKVSETLNGKNEAEKALDEVVEKVIPHDLSLVFLANEIFKGSEPLLEVGEIAFEKAFKKSLKTTPTLPNRF
jgi:hypothetical protein